MRGQVWAGQAAEAGGPQAASNRFIHSWATPGRFAGVRGGAAGYAVGRVIGAKPAAACRWIFSPLDAAPGDMLDDLFPGSGAVGRVPREMGSGVSSGGFAKGGARSASVYSESGSWWRSYASTSSAGTPVAT